MAFTLTIVRGENKGAVHSFDDGAVRIGRSDSSDIVIKDRGTSRNHARIFVDHGEPFVEDLNTTNGTMVNGRPVSPDESAPLSDGDEVTICDTVMRLQGRAGPRRVDSAAESLSEATNPTEDTNATRAMTAEELAARQQSAQAAQASALVYAPAPRELPEKTEAGPSPRANEGALAYAPSGRGERRLDRPEAAAPLSDVSAAERARIRRDLKRSLGGRVELFWNDLPESARKFLGTLSALGALGIVGAALFYAVQSNRPRPKEPEAVVLALNGAPIEQSFGYGPDVSYERADLKSFTFATVSPNRLVGILHYKAKNISQDEVSISLNGTDLGVVPPDTLSPETRDLEVVLGAATIKAREQNLLLFDNVRNPPGREDWRIWDLWLELIPLPELSADASARRAKDAIARAEKLYERRAIGAENLFLAWKTYREAWLSLESTPERPQQLHTIARTRMREIRPELDALCNSMLVPLRAAYEQQSYDARKIKALAMGITAYFPTREHPCFLIAQSIQRDLVEGRVRGYTAPVRVKRPSQ